MKDRVVLTEKVLRKVTFTNTDCTQLLVYTRGFVYFRPHGWFEVWDLCGKKLMVNGNLVSHFTQEVIKSDEPSTD